MTGLKVLGTPEFCRFEGCVLGMSGLISQGQYSWYFHVKGFAGVNLRAQQIVTAAYPGLSADCVKLEEFSFDAMVNEINHQLSEERPMWAMPGDPLRYAPFVLLPRDHAFWSLMKQCVDPEQAKIFRAEASDSLSELDWGISGGFTFVALSNDRSVGLIINAGNN